MFYDKQIDLMVRGNGYKDEYGIWHDGALTVGETIDCDVQPITKELAFKVFGVDEDVKYRIFCDPIQISPGQIIQYKTINYRIVSLRDWDNHTDFIVGDL